MKPLVLTFFFLITFLDSYFYGQGLEVYQFYFEPLIIPSILIYYLISSRKKESSNFTSLSFCMGGRFIIANRIISCFFTMGCFLLLANAIVFYRSL